jgi:hypothetical protein
VTPQRPEQEGYFLSSAENDREFGIRFRIDRSHKVTNTTKDKYTPYCIVKPWLDDAGRIFNNKNDLQLSVLVTHPGAPGWERRRKPTR